MRLARAIPRPVIGATTSLYTAIRRSRGNNQFTYQWNGYTFQFVYPNHKALTYFYNAIDEDEGVTGQEGVPLSLLELPDRVDGIVDAGAHFGMYTVLLGVMNRDRPLLAYEPSRYNLDILEENIDQNGLEAEAIQGVLAGTQKAVTLSQGPSHDRHLNLHDDTIAHSITEGRKSMSEPGTAQFTSTVLSDELADRGWTNPFVKIDIEGAEYGVMNDLMEANLDTLQGIVELHPDRMPEGEEAHEILFWFEEEGFDFELVKRSANRPAYWFSSD